MSRASGFLWRSRQLGARCRSHGVWCALLFLCLSVSIHAQGANPADQARVAMVAASGKALQTLQSKSDGLWTVSTNRDTGLPRMLMGGRSPSYGTSAVEAAWAFIEDNSDVFLPGNRSKPPAERIALKLVSARALAGSAMVEFRAEYVAIPVEGAFLSTQVDPSGRVALVTSSVDPRMPASTKPAKTFNEVDSALRSVQAMKGVRVTPATNILVILPGSTPRLAYQAFYKVGASAEPWEYLLDADSGEVLKAVRLVAEDAIGPPATASRQGVKREESSAGTGKDRRLATCRAHVDLTADREKGVGRVVADGEAGNPAASTSIATACATIDGLVGGKDADGDGYYDSYQFQIGIDGDASTGSAPVYARIICDTTGQRWRTGTWMVSGSVCDRQYFGFDETDFPEQFTGISALDFTVEIWSSATVTPSRRKATASGESQEADYATASGRTLVFNPNPVNTLNDPYLMDLGDSDLAVPFNAYLEVDLTHLASPAAPYYQYQLIGDYVKMEDIVIDGMPVEPPANIPPSSSTRDFRYQRSNDAFEEVMCYYHITRNQEYIQSLGFPDINNRQHRVDAHGLNYYPDLGYGAHYVGYPSGFGYMAFGDLGVDAAEDADVILHEYGHSIQDNSAPGVYFQTNNIETLAMGEGFGDYWACSCTYSESITSGCSAAYVAEWWSTPDPASMRRVNTSKLCPDDMAPWNPFDLGSHANGEIWSACLWDLFNAVGKTTSDRIILESHRRVRSISPTPGFEHGELAIVAADQALYGGAHVAQILSIFSARGIPTAPPRGTLQFSAPTYAVNENGGNVAITVTRTGGSFGTASVHCATADGSAMAGVDYIATRGVLNWTNRDTAAKTFMVPIVNDSIPEGSETFSVNLTLSPASRISLGSPSSATVTIGPPGTVQMSSTSYSVNENDGTITITATRTGGSFGMASVYYTTASGSAAAGADYTPQSGTLTWGDGEAGTKTFAVPIVDDALYEGDESFTVSIAGVGGSAAGSPAWATVTITDNDRANGTTVLTGGVYSEPNGNNRKTGGTKKDDGKGSGESKSRSQTRPSSGNQPSQGEGSESEVIQLPSVSMDAAWLFEEGRGNIVSDALVEGRTGVVHGAEWSTNTTASGSRFALEFHGTNDWVDLGRDADMMPSAGLTLSVWGNIGSSNMAGAIVASCFRSGDGSNTTGYGIFQADGSSGTLTWALGLQGATNDAVLRINVTNDTWQHVAMTYDRSSGFLRAYLNGQLAGELDVGSRDIAYTGSEVLAVGRNLRGCVDEVRVYSRVLSPPGVSALYRGFPLLPFVHGLH